MKRMAFVALTTIFLAGGTPVQPYGGVGKTIGHGKMLFAIGYDGHGENDALVIQSLDEASGELTGTFGRIGGAVQPVTGSLRWTGSAAMQTYSIRWTLPAAPGGARATTYEGAFVLLESETAFIAGTLQRPEGEEARSVTIPFCGHGLPPPG
jgi:hypothetical protein